MLRQRNEITCQGRVVSLHHFTALELGILLRTSLTFQPKSEEKPRSGLAHPARGVGQITPDVG